jgi:hypothetical protein
VCAWKIVAKRRQQVIDALEAGRVENPDCSWRMLTLTLRHERGMPLRRLIRGLLAAWRRTRQRGTIQRLWKEHVRASIRALEITEGEHGWHPHLHVLLLIDGWPTWEPSALVDTWLEMVPRELSVENTPSPERGVWWSHEVSEQYLTKLGLEITGTAKGNAAWAIAAQAAQALALSRDEDETPTVRERALETSDRCRAKWREYESATKGARAIELDERAAAMAKRGEVIRLGAIKPLEEVKERTVTVISMGDGWMRKLQRLERWHPAILSQVLQEAERAPPDDAAATAAVHGWIREMEFAPPCRANDANVIGFPLAGFAHFRATDRPGPSSILARS